MANAWLMKPLAVPSISASSTTVGDVAYLLNDYAGLIWHSNTTDGYARLTMDFGADTPLDAILLFGVLCAFPNSAVLEIALATTVQGNGFNGSITSSGVGTGNYWAAQQPPLAGATPTSGSGVVYWEVPAADPPPSSVRYVQLSFYNLAGQALQISRLVIGKRLTLQRNFSYGGTFGVRDLGSLDFSRRAVLLRSRGKRLRTLGLTFSNIRKEEVEATTGPLMERIGNTDMIALVTDPSDAPQRQSRCYFGPLVGDLSHTWRNAAAWEAKINMVSIF